ncbi:MAG: hypothetical protein QJR09_11170 [Micrococcus sp.]|nr:hypothetical protein [Micrococcus sp.]
MTENPHQPGAPTPGGQQAQAQPPYAAPQQQPHGAAPQQPYYPAPGDQGSKYGTTAYNAGAVAQDMAAPKGLGRLRTLTLASLAIYVLSSIMGMLVAGNEDYLDAQLDAQAGMGIPREQLEEAVAASMAFAMVFSIIVLVIAVALYLVVYFGLRGGKNWARILGTVLAAIGTLFTAWSCRRRVKDDPLAAGES